MCKVCDRSISGCALTCSKARVTAGAVPQPWPPDDAPVNGNKPPTSSTCLLVTLASLSVSYVAGSRPIAARLRRQVTKTVPDTLDMTRAWTCVQTDTTMHPVVGDFVFPTERLQAAAQASGDDWRFYSVTWADAGKLGVRPNNDIIVRVTIRGMSLLRMRVQAPRGVSLRPTRTLLYYWPPQISLKYHTYTRARSQPDQFAPDTQVPRLSSQRCRPAGLPSKTLDPDTPLFTINTHYNGTVTDGRLMRQLTSQ